VLLKHQTFLAFTKKNIGTGIN